MNKKQRRELVLLSILALGCVGGLIWQRAKPPPDRLTTLWTGAIEAYCDNSPIAGAKVMEVSRLILEGTEFATNRCPLIRGTNLLQDWDSISPVGEQFLLLDGDVLKAWGWRARECFVLQSWNVKTIDFLTDLGC